MKISFVEPHLELFGGIRRVVELSNRLIDSGESVSIFHPAGTPCAWMPCKARVRPLADVFREQHDAIIFNDPPQYKIVQRTSSRLKVFYILGLYDRDRLKRFSLKLLWPKKGRVVSIQRILRLPYLKLTNATWMQRFLADELRVHAELVIGGVNRDVFHPVSVPRIRDRFRILCTGDPRPYKGMDTVTRAHAIVKARHPRVELDTYYGKGIPQDRMAETYAGADLFVDAQWNTGSGWNNPVAEAMACKVPVVCTDIGGVEDFAFADTTALLVRERNPEGLAEAMIRLIDDEKLRIGIGEAGYRHILQFDWDKSAETLKRVLYSNI
jgi:glycosyltransferase involved in cell wall biosynthesis